MKNVRPSHGVILCHLDAGKNSDLEKNSLPKSLFTKVPYQTLTKATLNVLGHFCEGTFW
jgi:hypothetical protein